MIDSTRVSLKDIASSQKSATFSHLVIKSNQNKAPLSERGKSTPALAVLQDPSPAASFLSTLRLFSGLKALTFDCGRSAFPDFSISRPVQTRPNSDAHPPHPSDCPGGPAACLRPRHRPAFPPPRPHGGRPCSPPDTPVYARRPSPPDRAALPGGPQGVGGEPRVPSPPQEHGRSPRTQPWPGCLTEREEGGPGCARRAHSPVPGRAAAALPLSLLLLAAAAVVVVVVVVGDGEAGGAEQRQEEEEQERERSGCC